ncbi:MAG: trp operon repressor [Spirochaetes bacterium]|jgi:TrpR family trp operon transcriptional repressor|nr:trp operon repressor [Spirochaetota bacterium]
MYKLKEIAGALALVEDEKIIEDFLKSLLTNNEISEISSRWELVKLLNKGISQRKISEALGLSLCKITRGSRELRKKNSSFRHMIEIEASRRKNNR